MKMYYKISYKMTFPRFLELARFPCLECADDKVRLCVNSKMAVGLKKAEFD